MAILGEHELRALMRDLESDRVERTEATKAKDKFCRAICSFANDLAGHGLPGYLLIGLDDKGQPSGLRATDELLRNLGALRSEGLIQPMPMMSVGKMTIDGDDIVVVTVQPSDMPPVRYDGRVHVRIGPRKAIASEQEERLLTERRVAAARSFDLRPCMGSALDDLALDLFTTYRLQAIARETIDENERTLEQQLGALRFLDPQRGSPTNAGIIAFGKDPRRWLPGAYVQFLVVDGVGLDDRVFDAREIGGDLLTLLRDLDAETKRQIQRRPEPADDSVLRERTAASYPFVAIRELLLNAVMHRDYESNGPIRFYWFRDRVEIQSPGGLYGDARPENFPDRNDYRNPVVAEAMKVFGYVDKYGRGIVRANRALRDNGNPEAEFRLEPSFVQVTLRAAG